MTILLRFCGYDQMEIYWYLPRIKQAKSSRTSAIPEASNMMGPLLVSVSAQIPPWSRLLLAATRRSVSAKPASLFRHKMKTDQCHFCGDKDARKLLGSFWEASGKLLGRGLNTEIRRPKDTSNLTAAHRRASHPFSCSQIIIKQQNRVGS